MRNLVRTHTHIKPQIRLENVLEFVLEPALCLYTEKQMGIAIVLMEHQKREYAVNHTLILHMILIAMMVGCDVNIL